MILPGLISAAFYRRPPSHAQIAAGFAFTVLGSAALGYVQDAGTPRVWLNVVLAIVGGVVLYLAILLYLHYRYFPAHAEPHTTAPQTSAPPQG